MEATQQQRFDELRRRAEEHLQQAKPALDDRSYEDIQTLLHDLHVHQIELTLQNEELHRTQLELQESRNRYIDLYDYAPVGYLTVDENGLIVEVNLTCTKMLGVERSRLLKRTLSNCIVKEDEDIYYLRRKKILDTKTPQACELRLRREDGSSFWANLECAPVLDDNDTVTHIRIAITDITAREQMEEQLRIAFKEKEVLLKEVYHRVKNNFMAVSSLLSLQADAAEDPHTREVLEESKNRVQLMTFIHERLYQSDNLAEIDFGGCLYSIAAELFHTYNAYGIRLRSIITEKVFLAANTAIPCAMLVNELVSNALKYAFPEGRSGEIRLELHEQDEQVILVVSDTGVGLPPDVDLANSPSLGLQLVDTFVQQLQGTVDIERNPGTTFTITFPK